MNRQTKLWLVIAICLVLVGGIIFGGVMTVLKWDFRKLSTTQYETKEYAISGNFSNIAIHTDTADITFVPAEDGACKVVCYQQCNMPYSATVTDGTLNIHIQDTRKWYDYIGIHFGTPKVTVYLPQAEYGTLTIREDTGDITMPKDFQFETVDLALSTGDVHFLASAAEEMKIKTSTGGICVENASAGALDLSATTGKITVSGVTCTGDAKLEVTTGKTILTDLTCENLTSDGDTGQIVMSNMLATGKLSITRDTGDVKFDRCDASEIFVETDTGNITGSLLTDKVFFAQSDTGRVDVPKSVTGGRCEISTDTGNIKISVK